MRAFCELCSPWVVLCLWAAAAITVAGCSRAKYRTEADREAYDVIAERNADPRWHAENFGIEPNPRSRFFDHYDPDHSPMPLDDPSSHRYMRIVDGKKGWKRWDENGHRIDLENPAWHGELGKDVELGEAGSVKLNVDSSLRLAYVHSPFHQRQLETLYLSALDVTAERFRLDTQFFGGYDVVYNDAGSLVPASLTYDNQAGKFVVTPPFRDPGRERSRLTVGRPNAANPALQAQRRFATAGELLVGFANSFVVEFTKGDVSLASSLASFSFIQPLLRGAGKDVALEQLTFEERKLLANLRAYGQFRQGFFTQVVYGELGVTVPQRAGFGTSLQSFSGQAGPLGGFLGLLQQRQQVRYSEDLLRLQLRTLALLSAFQERGVIDLVQVDQFRQSVENERANLLRLNVDYKLALDRYKAGTIGLPPDLPVDLDESLLRQFELVTDEAMALQDAIIALRVRIGRTSEAHAVAVLEQSRQAAFQLVEPIRRQLEAVRKDLARMDEMVRTREETMDSEEIQRFREDRERLHQSLADRQRDLKKEAASLPSLRNGPTKEMRAETRRALLAWVSRIGRLVERAVLVQGRARLEVITVESISLESRDAFGIALANRLDFMNGRAALVDRWRLIQFNADALQSVVNVTASGDLRTARNNPVSFRAPTGSVRLGLEFDAPFTRLLERNAYREALIEYQRSRRDLIQSRDGLHLGLRGLLRTVEQLRENLEIQRRAVTIAIRLVDQTQARLAAPPSQPGQRFNPTTSINLLSAQNSLRDSQSGFLSVWLNYYAARLRLYRELGIMALDSAGRLIEYPLPGSGTGATSSGNAGGGNAPNTQPPPPLPPMPPAVWMDMANRLASRPNSQGPMGTSVSTATPTGYSGHSGHPAPIRPPQMHQLPPPASRPAVNRPVPAR